ncbi:MAG TPA: class I SAM-dependent methyltransferase, partial [Chlamydiales bacterium]|nr:class I SAM-dependent methyltransferase [Chlamydiales bacterium]
MVFSFLDGIESTWKGHEQFALWLVQHLHPKTIVDLGFDRGLSTIAFAYRNRGHVFGIDWFEEGNYAVKSFALDSAFRNISNAIRFNYVKNIHLIIGPFRDVSRKWTRKIDILHIDWAHSYVSAKQHYDNWAPYLKSDAVILVHDILSYPEETGRFFRELAGYHKVQFSHAEGLGIATTNLGLVNEIKQRFDGAF